MASVGELSEEGCGRLVVQVVPAGRSWTAEWAELAKTTGLDLFAGPEWFVPWAKAFAPGRLHYVLATRGSRLVGLLPVVPDGRTLRSATNSETVRYSPVLVEPALLVDIVKALPSRWRRISLGYLPAHELTPTLEAYGSSRGVRIISREIRRSPTLSTVGDFRKWESERLSANRRHNLRRLRRRLSEVGEVRFEVSDGSECLQDLMEEGFALEASGWKRAAGGAVLSRPAVHRFYLDLTAWASSVGALRLFQLRLDGRSVAFFVTIERGGVVSGLKMAYDECYQSYSPGVLLTQSALEYCFTASSIRRFDFLGEAERYKTQWTDDSEVQLQVELFAPGTRSMLEMAIVRCLWGIRELMRQRVPLEVRERIDTSSPRRVVGSAAVVVRTMLSRRSTPTRGARTSAIFRLPLRWRPEDRPPGKPQPGPG